MQSCSSIQYKLAGRTGGRKQMAAKSRLMRREGCFIGCNMLICLLLLRQYVSSVRCLVYWVHIIRYLKMMLSKKLCFMALGILLYLSAVAHCQNEINLELNKILTVTLPAAQHQRYVITIPNQPTPSQHLFVTAESPFNDPFQQPNMAITSTQGFEMSCSDESSSYTGICKIDYSEMSLGRQFILEVYCLTDCTLKIAAYLSDIFKLELGKSIELTSMKDYGLAQLLKVDLPPTLTFSSILILARLENYQSATEGVSVLANYGSNITEPSEENFMVRAHPTYGHRLSIEIPGSSISAGEEIILYLFIGINNTIQLSTYVIDNSIASMRIGSPMVDFTSNGETKKYIANFQQYQGLDLDNKDIMVKIIIYSGSPEVKLSFDENFTDFKTQDNWFIESSFVYLLSPTFRKTMNFTNKLYVSVSSFFLASYYLELIVNNKNFIALQNNIMELAKIVPDGLQNFIYEDENYIDEIEADGRVRYKATVQMIEGSVQVGIRDCDSLMDSINSKVQDCLIKNVSQLRDQDIKKTFDNVQGEMRKFFNTYEITFYYNVTKCPKVSVNSHLERYVCDYHIILHNMQPFNNAPTEVYLGIEITKYSEPRQLKQGVILRDSVPQQEYNYYWLDLTSVENVSKVEVYTTVIQGDISMLISRAVKFPEFEDLTGNDVKINIFGHYVIEGDQLTSGIYYIAIYGYEITDYTISVAIQRFRNNTNNTNNNDNNDSNTEVTEIKLHKGLSQSFTMGLNKQLMKFSITPTKIETTVIKIAAITGTISYQILQKADSTLICDSFSLSQLPDPECQFTSKTNTTYVIAVRGNKEEVETFMISYSDAQTCNSYPNDIPMYLSLQLSSEADNRTCFSFSLLKIKDTEITVAMSDLDKIKSKGYLSVSLEFKASHKTIQLKDYESILTATQLEVLCASTGSAQENVSPDASPQGCQFQLQVVVNSTKYKASNPNKDELVGLMIAVQGFDEENVLFDGIPEKLITDKISQKTAKHFYYFVYDVSQINDLNVYLTTQTDSKYQIAGRVISDTTYARDYDGVEYPSFNSNATDVLVANSTQYSPITALTIKKQLLKKFADQSTVSIVLISVYGIPTTLENQTYIFKIQATSTSTFLAYGESKLGYVDKDQIYEYEVNIDNATPSVLTVRPLGLEKCMRSYVLVSQFVKQSVEDEGRLIQTTVEFDKIRPFSSERGSRQILIKGTSNKMCTYQISHNALNSPLKSVLQGVPYEVKIETIQGTAYYLYNSLINQSFHIIQMINGGNSIIYALPIAEVSTESMEDLLNKNVETFLWKSDLNANLYINKGEEHYCSNCYYLIAVRGKNVVNGELVVITESLPIPLKQGSILKDKLSQNSTITYLFYSTTSFNLTITPLYGQLNILVALPSNPQNPQPNISISAVSSTKQIPVLVPPELNKNGIDYFDPNARFLVIVTATKDSSFFVGVRKIESGVRLFEGMPISMEAKTETIVSFANYDRQQMINILVQNLQYSVDSENALSFEANKTNHAGVIDSKSVPNIIEHQLEIEGSYNLQLYSQVADYTLRVRAQRPTNVSIILAKVSLTHLVAARTLVVTNPAIFQIFSPGDSIMIEIFSCLGQIEVTASSNYTQIANSSSQNAVRMEHANYGGHYVISAEDLKGEYYVQTKSLAPEDGKTNQLSYLIKYSLYSPLQQKMPYKTYGIINTFIQYSYKPNKIEYRLNKIYRKDLGSTPGEAIYTLYISNSTESITKMTKCSLGQVYSLVVTQSNVLPSNKDNGQFVTFALNQSELANIIGNSSFYYVGGEASFTWSASNPHHANSVAFVYDISQMVSGNQPEFKSKTKTDNTFFVLLWIVVPFAIGSFVFYLAVKYFINSIRQGPNQLIEQEVGDSQEVFGAQAQAADGYKIENKPPADHNPDKYAIE